MKNSSKGKERGLGITGLAFIVMGLMGNEWILAAWFSSDGIIAPGHRWVIRAAEVVLIGTGIFFIRYRRSLTKEWILLIAGFFTIVIGLMGNEYYLSVLFGFRTDFNQKLIIWAIQLYIIGTGIFVIAQRKSLLIQHAILYGLSTLFCIGVFLAYDMYQVYAKYSQIRDHMNREIYDVHIVDDRLGWRPKPSSTGRHVVPGVFDATYRIDQDGFRAMNNPRHSNVNVYFFGDSFTFGYGVDDEHAFPAVFKEEYMTEEVSVYNAGVMGYGIVQMYQRFLDIEDRIDRGDLVVLTPITDDIRRNIHDFVFFYSMVVTELLPGSRFPSYEHGVLKYDSLQVSFYNNLKYTALMAPYTGGFWRSVYEKSIPDTVKQAIDVIETIGRRLERKGAQFALIFLPEVEECAQKAFNIDLSGFGYLDILAYFPSDEEVLRRIKLQGDKHWNEDGHRMAAGILKEVLVNANLIDRRYLKEGI